KVVDAKKIISGFEDVFVIQKKSTYANKDHLVLLTKKAELASLNITMDKKQMPLGFSSRHLPAYNKCDHCHMLLCDGTDKKKSNLKEFIDADEDSPQNQVISNEDNIL
ncbi:44124_t:CDS:2, partial [Gigaspora margarita]